jgi:hypothetical protein
MKTLLAAFLLSGSTASACPDLLGKYSCESEAGVTSTKSIFVNRTAGDIDSYYVVDQIENYTFGLYLPVDPPQPTEVRIPRQILNSQRTDIGRISASCPKDGSLVTVVDSSTQEKDQQTPEPWLSSKDTYTLDAAGNLTVSSQIQFLHGGKRPANSGTASERCHKI